MVNLVEKRKECTVIIAGIDGNGNTTVWIENVLGVMRNGPIGKALASGGHFPVIYLENGLFTVLYLSRGN